MLSYSLDLAQIWWKIKDEITLTAKIQNGIISLFPLLNHPEKPMPTLREIRLAKLVAAKEAYKAAQESGNAQAIANTRAEVRLAHAML